MSKFKKPSNLTQSNEAINFINGANEKNITPDNIANKFDAAKTSFLLKLEQNDHELLKLIAEKEERSMQWMLRKITSEVIRKKAEELGILN